MNLFEDGLRETLETTRLPCNVSKINDCMKKLDPTYRLDETGVTSLLNSALECCGVLASAQSHVCASHKVVECSPQHDATVSRTCLDRFVRVDQCLKPGTM